MQICETCSKMKITYITIMYALVLCMTLFIVSNEICVGRDEDGVLFTSIAGASSEFYMRNINVELYKDSPDGISTFLLVPQSGADPIRSISIFVRDLNGTTIMLATLAVTDDDTYVCSDDSYYSYSLDQQGVGTLTFDNLAVQNIASDVKFETLKVLGTSMGKTITISYVLDGGSATGNPTQATYGAHAPTLVNLPTKSHYVFGGFYTQPNARGTLVYNSHGASDHLWDLAENTTLYAYWIGETYTVFLDGGDGLESAGTMVVYNVVYGSAMPKIIPPVRHDYTFGGYYTQADGAGVQYYDSNGDSVRAFDNENIVKLYAKWTASS